MKLKTLSMNKAGKGNTGLYIFGSVVVILLVALVFGIYSQTAYQDEPKTETPDYPDIGACPDSTATVSFSSVKEMAEATSVSPTATVRVDGAAAAASTTSYAVGANLEILWNASDYIDKITTYTVPCGGGPITTKMYATDDQAFRIFGSNGDLLTDDAAGGATNQSALGSGGAKSLKIYIDGSDKESSGDLVIVAEHTNQTGCDKITLSGLGGASESDVPGFYTVSAAGAKAYAWEVPAIIGAQTVEGTLGVKAKSGQVCSGAIYVTAYSKEAFQDTDGTFKVGIEDSDEGTEYEDDWDYDFYIDAA
jgi:hypothetical protein